MTAMIPSRPHSHPGSARLTTVTESSAATARGRIMTLGWREGTSTIRRSAALELRCEADDAPHRHREDDSLARLVKASAHFLDHRDRLVDLGIFDDANDRLVPRPASCMERAHAGEDRHVLCQHVSHALAADHRRPRDAELDESGQEVVELFRMIEDGDEELHARVVS